MHLVHRTVRTLCLHPHPRLAATGATLAAVHHYRAVGCPGVESIVAQPQGTVADRLRLAEPGRGDRFRGVGDGETAQRGVQKRGVGTEPRAVHQVSLLGRVTEVVVAAAWTGIGALQHFLDRGEALRLGGQTIDLGAAFVQPQTVVQRILQPVQAGPAAHRLRAIARHRELHVHVLKQRLGKGVGAGAQLALERRCRRVVEDRQRAPARRPRAEIGGAPQLAVRAALRRGLGKQPFADVGVGVGAVEKLQQSPALQHPRRGGSFQGLQTQQRGRHVAVGQQRTAPVGLQAQNRGRNPVGQVGMYEQAAILAQHRGQIGRGIPQQGAPQHLVEVVAVALAVGQGADRVRGGQGEDARLIGGAGIDRLAPLADRQRRIPIRYRVLARPAVGDVGVETDRIARRHAGAERLCGHVDPGTEDHPIQPVEPVFQRRVEVLLVGAVEPLRSDPHLRPRVQVVQRRLLPFGQCQQQTRRRRSRIAAGNEHGVDPRQGGKHLAPLGEGAPYRRSIAVVGLQGGKPDPQVHVVTVGDCRYLPHHVDLRQREVVGVGGIV